MAALPTPGYDRRVDVEAVDLSALVAALVTLWFWVSGAYAALVGIAAIRTGAYAPRLGLDLRGPGASVAGWITLVLALALFAAGALVSYVELVG